MRYVYLLSIDGPIKLSTDQGLELTSYVSDILDCNQVTLKYLGSKDLKEEDNDD